MTRSWLKRLFPASRPIRRNSSPARPLWFVQLEDRITPAQFYVDPDFTGAPGTLVDFNSPGGPNEKIGAKIGTDAFATIAEALTAANTAAGADQIFLSKGDTHDVDPIGGTLAVTESVQIVGSGSKGETLVQVISDTIAASGPDGAVFRADGAGTKFDVSDLTFDGSGDVGKLVGSAFRFEAGTTGSLTNVGIQDVIDDSDPTINLGFGVVAIGKDTTVFVNLSTFKNIGREGVRFDSFATGAVSGSTFVGRTSPTLQVQYGVSVIEGAKNVQITGNGFIDFTAGLTPGSAAINIADDLAFDASGDGNNANEPATAVVVGNLIKSSEVGIAIGQDVVTDSSDAFIRFNTIAGNTVGVSTFTSQSVDGLRNFWGSPTGPTAPDNPGGTGDEVDTKVVYQVANLAPGKGFLIAAPAVASVLVPPGGTLEEVGASAASAYIAATGFDFTTFYVDPNFTTPGAVVAFNGGPNMAIVGEDAFATIAEAIAVTNANPGLDQIFLSATKHAVDPSTGTLAITDALQLNGSGKTATTIQVIGDTVAASGSDGAVFRSDGVQFDVLNLTFDGDGENGKLVGSAFRYEGGTGTISDVIIQDVIDDSDPTLNLGFGIVAIGKGSSVAVANSVFTNIGREGVRFDTFATGSVSNSTFTARPAADAQVQIGIAVTEGSTNVQISGNTISGYKGQVTGSAGVLVADDVGFDGDGNGDLANEPASAILVGNSITNNEVGVAIGQDVALDDSDAFLRYNSIAGNTVGVSNFTTQSILALRNFWGSPSGPTAPDNPGGTGDEVDTNVVYQQAGLFPGNKGFLVAAPAVVTVPVQPGTAVDDIGASAARDYVTLSNFDFPAFYVDPGFTTNGEVVTFEGGPTTAIVGEDAFATIAEAIAAANINPALDKVFLSTATHDVDPSGGTLAITDPLQLIGAGQAKSIIQVTGDTVAATGPDGAVFRADGVAFNVQDLTLKGGGDTGTLVGSAFRFEGATGSISNVTIQDVLDDSDPTINLGFGVVAIGKGTSVAVTNTSFTNIGREGIRFDTFATGSVAGSTFTGRDVSANVLAQYGVSVFEGSENVQITGNTFTGYDDANDDPVTGFFSAAIFIADDQGFDGNGDTILTNEPATAVVVGNSIKTNEVGVLIGQDDEVFDNSDAFVRFNTIQGNTEVGGVVAFTNKQVDAHRNFWGNPTGPTAPGNPGGSGDKVIGSALFKTVLTPPAFFNPNDGILIKAPPIQAIQPPEAGADLDAIGTNVENKYITITGFDLVNPVPVFMAVSGTLPTVSSGTEVKVLIQFGEALRTDEPTLVFDAGDLTVGGTAAGASVVSVTATGNPGEFLVTLTSTGDGTITLALDPRLVQDTTGNYNKAAAATPVAIVDTTGPVVTITSNDGSPLPSKLTNPFTVKVNFSEVVTGFDADDISFTGSTAGGTPVVTISSTDGKTYSVQIGGFTSPGDVTMFVREGAGQDAAGNDSNSTGPTLVADGTNPSITIAPANGPFSDPLIVTFTFTEPVTGFEIGDITLGGTQQGGTVQELKANATNTVFTAKIGGFTTVGVVTVRVDGGKAFDLVGNPNDPAGPVTVATPDSTRPTTTISIPGKQLPVPFTPTIGFRVTFSEPVTDFDDLTGDVLINGTAQGGSVLSITPVVGGNGQTYDVSVGQFTSPGDVIITIPDGAAQDASGNDNVASSPTLVAEDTIGPDVTIGAVTGSLPIAFTDPLSFTVTFTESVTGFDKSDIRFTGSTAAGFTVQVTPDAANKVFTVRLDGFTTKGSVIVTIPDGSAFDASGNGNNGDGPTTVTTGAVDTKNPTPTITSPAGPLPVTFTAGTLTLTVTFDEAVTNFDKTDVQLDGSTATGGSVQTFTPAADGKTFTVVVGGFTAPGSVIVTLDAGAALDLAGNPSNPLTVTAGNFVAQTFTSGFTAGGGEGISQPFFQVDGPTLTAGKSITPFEAGFIGGVRTSTADVNGDGVLDSIVGPGPGRINEVRVYDGANFGKVIFSFNPFEASFTGGVFVHGADLNGDGKAEVIVSPDVTGGPRVRILDGANAAAGKAVTIFDFFGIDDPDFRGGARVGSGDLNGDGTPDLFVAAGFQGGPRVAIYDGKFIAQGKATKLVGDFFGYESTLRNGVFIAGADANGDGFAEIILGAGPSGGPRVRVLDGKAMLTNNSQVEVLNFFAFDSSNRGGVRVAASDLDGDGKVDIVTGPGVTGGSTIRIFPFDGSSPTSLNLFGDFQDGVYVG